MNAGCPSVDLQQAGAENLQISLLPVARRILFVLEEKQAQGESMSESSQLVFYGEILPGHDAATVQTKLGELLKLPAEQIAAVFSGRRIVLRKSLPNEQAASYVARLEKIGVKVFAETVPQIAVEPAPAAAVMPTVQQLAEDMAPQISPLAATAATPSPERLTPPALETPALAIAPAAPVEEMDCPKCGEHQPRRTLCRACSVDMRRFAEARQQQEQEAREERMLAREVALASNGRGGHARVSDDAVSIFGLGFSGRLGRLCYLAGSLGAWAIGGFAVVALIKLDSLFVAGLGLIISTLISIRLAVLRCHDANWSGWLTLIFFIPYIGPLFGLVLLLMPGTQGENKHGSPSPSPGLPVGFAMLVLFAFSIGSVYKQQDAFIAYAMNKTMGGAMPQAGRSGGGPVLSVAEADVEMFTTSSCGVCHMAKAYMNQRGITYAEKDVEKDEDYLRDFYARGGRGVPFIFVGGQSMEGFDPEQLERMLASRRG
jgi:glutaredoxin/uncharacterized membrane protein YhaH (DUF805 family)